MPMCEKRLAVEQPGNMPRFVDAVAPPAPLLPPSPPPLDYCTGDVQAKCCRTLDNGYFYGCILYNNNEMCPFDRALQVRASSHCWRAFSSQGQPATRASGRRCAPAARRRQSLLRHNGRNLRRPLHAHDPAATAAAATAPRLQPDRCAATRSWAAA